MIGLIYFHLCSSLEHSFVCMQFLCFLCAVEIGSLMHKCNYLVWLLVIFLVWLYRFAQAHFCSCGRPFVAQGPTCLLLLYYTAGRLLTCTGLSVLLLLFCI